MTRAKLIKQEWLECPKLEGEEAHLGLTWSLIQSKLLHDMMDPMDRQLAIERESERIWCLPVVNHLHSKLDDMSVEASAQYDGQAASLERDRIWCLPVVMHLHSKLDDMPVEAAAQYDWQVASSERESVRDMMLASCHAPSLYIEWHVSHDIKPLFWMWIFLDWK